MPSTGDTGRQRPFQNGDQFESSSTHVLEDQDHPFMRQLNEAIGSHTLDEVIQLVSEWKRVSQLPPHHGPADDPVGALGPALFHAIRADRFDVVAYLLDQGVKPSRLALWEAVSCKSSSAMWQVFLDHGLDINAPLEDSGTSPLGFILDNEALVRWFLAHGADPNTESRNGLTPFLRAVGWAPLSTVSLLHQAGGSTALAVPFVCSPWPPRASTNSGNSQAPAEPESESTERLAVLRYVLDAGADPDARKWAHNRRGYAGDFDWGSGLNAALVNGAHDLANELLRRGARTDIPTFNIASRGETALELSGRYAPHLLPITKELRMKQESS